jgi:hypothetical protein
VGSGQYFEYIPTISVFVEPIGAGLLGLLSDTSHKNVLDASSSLLLAFVRSTGLALEQVIEGYSRCLNVPLSARLAHLLLELHEKKDGESIVRYKHGQITNLLSTYRDSLLPCQLPSWFHR